jgi:putative hydrolase of the HAD superfamily
LKKAVLFDLGNTLAQYYDQSEFPAILEQGISNVADHLKSLGIPTISKSDLSERVRQENHESKDFRVRPLEERLTRIFQLTPATNNDELFSRICRRFMEPIFALGRVYDDAFISMRELRSNGYRVGIVSNTSWGSPALLWREELARLGLQELTDKAIFCRDVGWRKPDSRIFTYALQELAATADESVFVGDEPQWDFVGPRAVGMDAIVIDRRGRFEKEYPDAIRSLRELPRRLRDRKNA